MRVPFWFAVPCLVVFAAIVAYPTIQGVYYAFTDWSGLGSDIHFNGLHNFRVLFSSADTVGALWHTLLMAAVITIVQNAIGLALPPLAQIDHVLVGPSMAAVGMHTVDLPGSDHRGVVAEVARR